MPQSCSIEGCEKPTKSRGWCGTHYDRWRRKGDPLWRSRCGEPCVIEGCDEPYVSRGWCQLHYGRWHRYGDPLFKPKGRWDGQWIDHTQSKVCVECGATYHPTPGRSHEQWARQQCCTPECSNALKARGRPRRIGDLSREKLGSKQAYQNEWQRRKSMPRWAAWWEDKRKAEDLADLAYAPVAYGKGAQFIGRRPKARHWIAGACPDCGHAVVVVRGWWHDSIRCPACTKKRWRQNHKQRAKMRGVEYEDIDCAVVFARDKRRCRICGKKTRGKYPAPTSATIDHITPLSKGGPHLMHNVQTACLRCNVKKYNGTANDQLRIRLDV